LTVYCVIIKLGSFLPTGKTLPGKLIKRFLVLSDQRNEFVTVSRNWCKPGDHVTNWERCKIEDLFTRLTLNAPSCSVNPCTPEVPNVFNQPWVLSSIAV
jgi:hypothetical protein